eukprot:6176486-Pleurochrysis_carterae.AAC.6
MKLVPTKTTSSSDSFNYKIARFMVADRLVLARKSGPPTGLARQCCKTEILCTAVLVAYKAATHSRGHL